MEQKFLFLYKYPVYFIYPIHLLEWGNYPVTKLLWILSLATDMSFLRASANFQNKVMCLLRASYVHVFDFLRLKKQCNSRVSEAYFIAKYKKGCGGHHLPCLLCKLKCPSVTLKVVSDTFLLVCFFNLNESTCQTRKNAFYFTSALFVLKKIKI